MINYYKELELDEKMSCEELGKTLFNLRKKYTQRTNSPDISKQQDAKNKIALIQAASQILNDKDERKKYDAALLKAKNKGTIEKAGASDDIIIPYSDFASMQRKFIEENTNEKISIMNTYYDNGNYEDVINLGKNLINEGQKNYNLYVLLTLSYMHLGDNANFMKYSQTGLSFYKDDTFFMTNLILGYVNACDYNSAKSYIQRVLTIDKTDVIANKYNIYILLRAGEKEKAEDAIKDFIRNNPEKANASIAEIYNKCTYEIPKLNKNGGTYIANKADYQQMIEYNDKAFSYNPGNNTTKSYKNYIEKMGKKIFNKKNLTGLAIVIVFWILSVTGCFFLNDGEIWQETNNKVGLVMLYVIYAAIAGVMVYFSFLPKWKIETENITGKYNILTIICKVLSYILIAVIAVYSFIFVFVCKMFKISKQVTN